MSVRICSNAHIDCIVSFGVAHRIMVPIDRTIPRTATDLQAAGYSGRGFYVDCRADLTGDILCAEHLRSVRVSRQDTLDTADTWAGSPLTVPYVFRRVLLPSPLLTLRAIATLEAQSRATPDYGASFACTILRHIRDAAIEELPGFGCLPYSLDEDDVTRWNDS